MNLFFDTSALVKLFHDEEGSDVVANLIENTENTVYLSELAKIEFYCALFRRFRNNELNKRNLDLSLDGF